MKKANIDIFKIALIIILIWIGYSLYNFSEIGSYQLGDNNSYIIDTRTGNAYLLHDRLIKE